MKLEEKPAFTSFLEETKKVLLTVKDLFVFFSLKGKKIEAVRGVSFDIFEGESVGVVGESGSGKSAIAEAITRLSSGEVLGNVFFQGADLASLPEKKLRSFRGKKIGHIFQDPLSSLNPTMRIGEQIEEAFLCHKMGTKKEAKKRALSLLELVGIARAEERFRQYPHELSGGMRQRVMIAIALIGEPDLLIADEPTTALDANIQAQILRLIKKIQKSAPKRSLLFISHDLRVISEMTDTILVVYAGKIVERGKTKEVLKNPQHPYTELLVNALPKIDPTHVKKRGLPIIEGPSPDPGEPISGCSFKERCPYRRKICDLDPPFHNGAYCWGKK